MRADLLHFLKTMAPGRRDIVSMIPKNVGSDAGNDVRSCELSDSLGLAPCIAIRVSGGKGAVADE